MRDRASSPADPREGVALLRGLLLCGLVVTAGTGEGWLHASFRGALPLVAGLAFGVAIAASEGSGRRVSPLWLLHLIATWLVTLWSGMWGNVEVVRTCAVAGCAVILVRGGGARVRLGLAAAAVVVVVGAWLPDAPYWLRVARGELLYGLGVAWPRGVADAALDGALFFLACGASARRGARALAGYGGLAVPLRALGRMPITAVAGQSLVAGLLLAVPVRAGPDPSWVGFTIMDVALVAQLVFAVAWLRWHERGPCEQLLGLAQAGVWSLGASLRRGVGAAKGNNHGAEPV